MFGTRVLDIITIILHPYKYYIQTNTKSIQSLLLLVTFNNLRLLVFRNYGFRCVRRRASPNTSCCAAATEWFRQFFHHTHHEDRRHSVKVETSNDATPNYGHDLLQNVFDNNIGNLNGLDNDSSGSLAYPDKYYGVSYGSLAHIRFSMPASACGERRAVR